MSVMCVMYRGLGLADGRVSRLVPDGYRGGVRAEQEGVVRSAPEEMEVRRLACVRACVSVRSKVMCVCSVIGAVAQGGVR